MRVGFTGTQRGMSESQCEALAIFLWTHRDKITEFHHGDCEGADSDAHDIACETIGESLIWIHPPVDSKKRAFRTSPHIARPRPYLERNHSIVDHTDILIATPRTLTEELRSGTWATIRYARKNGREVRILEP